MTITEFSEVAVPLVNYELQSDVRQVFCGLCGQLTDAVEIANGCYQCPSCKSNICVMCGCTEERACVGGCYWLSPGICSSHKQELHEMAARVFANLGGAR
jgi:hypothetical protein